MKRSTVKVVFIAFIITCLVTRSTLLQLVVLIFPLAVLVYPPVVLVYPLVALVCLLVVLVCPLVVSVCPPVVLVWPFVCPLAALVVLSVGLFITDHLYGLFANLSRITIAYDFSPSSLKLKRDILPPLTK